MLQAVEVAALLDAWWPIVAGPRPDDPNLRPVWLHKPGWPQRTTSAVGRRPRTVPVLWAAQTPIAEYPPGSPTAEPWPTPGLRMIAERPLTADRPHVVLPDPAPPNLFTPPRPSPAAASACATFVLTLRVVAEQLGALATLPSSPARQLTGEAGAYSATADAAEQLLDGLCEPWLDVARAAVEQAARPHSPPLRQHRRVPVSLA
jgi:hypothetical protein